MNNFNSESKHFNKSEQSPQSEPLSDEEFDAKELEDLDLGRAHTAADEILKEQEIEEISRSNAQKKFEEQRRSQEEDHEELIKTYRPS